MKLVLQIHHIHKVSQPGLTQEKKIAYLVTAIDDKGVYDIYMMNADGTDNHCITPSYFPDTFLCHAPIFSKDDSKIYFVGEWWK